ncbi:L,D-transpeptidase [Streptomyces sp. NBC_00536]|uniref:L,D-transpeptidase n=1 Tax=Streptomyces sp. NBC_00536 TaxID=2975769 RepID=UPI002E80087D|nr:L,D-transpeptidase [Streptomyces sp. NBC_00536]WUC81398.1 L,D-transpeptidase [Streptomyces sp. NBC_00536]
MATGAIRGAAALAAVLALTGQARPPGPERPPDGPRAAAPVSRAAPETPCNAGTGPYQRELEAYLRRPVDGVQSEADCVAIRGFQSAQGLRPAWGYANLGTYRTMIAVQARANPNAQGRCPVRTYRVTCVDMDRQLLWVQRDAKVVFAPVPIRTGRDTLETRPGWHEVYWRDEDHYSDLYDNAPMPYSQFFDEGQAIHGHRGNLYSYSGSAGCVNLAVPDAARLWDLLTEGDAVYVWGTKPGTDD